jgi:late competence protein required for DNA uptake (superfamily II DNA/RNA helicase)
VNQPLCIQAAIWRFYPDEATRHSALNRVLETLKTMPDLVPSNYHSNPKTLPDIYAFNNANRRLQKDIISLLEKAKV